MRGCPGQSGGLARSREFVAQRLGGHALAEVGEQEVGGPPGFRVLERPAG
jgi:hypothetical protein